MKKHKGRIGRYLNQKMGDESFQCYIPLSLPPHDPPLDMSNLYHLLEQASTAVGRLDGLGQLVPDVDLFVYMYVRKEAVLSSQIEGTRSTLTDLLSFEATEKTRVSPADTAEVSSYVNALGYSLERLEALPLSLRLIKEVHKILMHNSRGETQNPGQFRTSQNWIGGARPSTAIFVPPAAAKVMECLNSFEKFLHSTDYPSLIKVGLAHAQFETIHPFLDGNGRMGRLLITLMLCNEGMLQRPLLYSSLYFKLHRQEYYDLLQNVRITGNWEAWLEFFLTGIKESAESANDKIQRILHMMEQDEKLLKQKKVPPSVLAIYDHFKFQSVGTIQQIHEKTKYALATVTSGIDTLEKLGIIENFSDGVRKKYFLYKRFMDIVEEDLNPL